MALRGRFKFLQQAREVARKSKDKKTKKNSQDSNALIVHEVKASEVKIDLETKKEWNEYFRTLLNYDGLSFITRLFFDKNQTTLQFIKLYFVQIHSMALIVATANKSTFIEKMILRNKQAVSFPLASKYPSEFKDYFYQILHRSCANMDIQNHLIQCLKRLSQDNKVLPGFNFSLLEFVLFHDAKALCQQWKLKIDNKQIDAIKKITKARVIRRKYVDYSSIVILGFSLLVYKLDIVSEKFLLTMLAFLFCLKMYFTSKQAKIRFLSYLLDHTTISLENEYTNDNNANEPPEERLTLRLEAKDKETTTQEIDKNMEYDAYQAPNPKHTTTGMSRHKFFTQEKGLSSEEVKAMTRLQPADEEEKKYQKTATVPQPIISSNKDQFIINKGNVFIRIMLLEKANVPKEMLPHFIESMKTKGYIGTSKGPGICKSSELGWSKKWRPAIKSGGRIYCPKEIYHEDGTETWVFTRYFKNHQKKTVAKGAVGTQATVAISQK